MSEIVRDAGDMALQALISEVERPLSEKLRVRARELGRKHFGTSEADLLPENKLLGRYRLERVLGAGGQAVVYQARHDALPGRLAAIKVPHGDAKHRMLREANVMARLDHPGVLSILDVDLDGDQPHLVLEHCSGGSLADRVEAEGPLPEEEVARITRAILEALAYAHEQGVVHRDLKPANILFDGQGTPQIADFGLGKVVADQISLSLSQGTRTGIAGTPTYMAPEQERPGADVDGRTDLFAVGKLVYFMLTGLVPRTIRPLERDRPGIHPEWDELVLQLTESLPDSRPADAQAALALLAQVDPPQVLPLAKEPVKRARLVPPAQPSRGALSVFASFLAAIGYMIAFFCLMGGVVALLWGGGKAGLTTIIIGGFFFWGSSLLSPTRGSRDG